MSLLACGTVAFDSVETPFGKADQVLGGSATFFCFAASYLTPTRLMGIVGEDFPTKYVEEMGAREIDTAGLQVEKGGKTFHWTGKYVGDMNDAQTLGVSLNVLMGYKAAVPESFRDTSYVFLAADRPQTQLDVMAAVPHRKLAVADTRDMWITEEPDALAEVLRQVDGLVLNESEARLLTGEENLVRAGGDILGRGPAWCVIKKGEHGSLLFSGDGIHALPAYPLSEVRDPTGAGDSFAGGLMGYLASTRKTSLEAIKRGLTYGTVLASVCVQGFSVEAVRNFSKDDLADRHDAFIEATRF